MTVFDSILAYFASSMIGSFFGSPLIFLAFLYIIVIGIGIFSKMSLDGFLLCIGIVTFVGVPWAGTDALRIIYVIVGGMLVAISFLRFTRH